MPILSSVSLRNRGQYLRLRCSSFGRLYLVSVVLGAPAALLGNYLDPNFAIKGQGWTVLAPWVAFLISLFLWFCYRPAVQWPRIYLWFLTTLVGYWAVVILTTRVDGDALNYTSIITPFIIVMVALKSIDRETVFQTLDVFAWSLVFASGVAQVAVWLGIVTPRLDFLLRLPLLNIVGIDYRWEGPFANVNYAGPLAAFLIVYGVGRIGRATWQRWTWVTVGVAILIASEARGGFLAVLVGLFVLVVARPRVGPIELAKRRRIVAVIVAVIVVGTALLISDPTGNGRLVVWSEFIAVWPLSPVTGLSSEALINLRESGELSFFSTHAHNWLIQTLVDQGLIGLAVVLLALSFSVCIVLRGGRQVKAISIALLSLFLVASMVEDQITGAYLNLQFLSWLLIVSLASAERSLASDEKTATTS